MQSSPDIALVVLDTMRKDYFDDHFDWLPGQWFDWAFSTSHCTSPAHASLFTGQYPSEVGVYETTDNPDTDVPVVAEQLSKAGYRTQAYSANPLISPPFDFDRGFDEFRSAWKVQSAVNDYFDWIGFANKHSGATRYVRGLLACLVSDKPTLPSLQQAVRIKLGDVGFSRYQDDGARECKSWLDKRKSSSSPEFLFINLMEAHSPYRPPPEYRTVSDEGYYYPNAVEVTFTDAENNVDRKVVKTAYEDSVRYLSAQYRDIFESLQKQFDIIITCGDHGDLFGGEEVDGMWGHFHGVYEGVSHVPLVISGEGISDERTEESVSLRDVHDTILSMASLDDSNVDIRDGSGHSTVLTQTHGVPENQLSRLEEVAGTEARERAEAYNERFDGIALQSYYGHESVNGWFETGECPDSAPKTLLDNARSDLDESSASSHGEMTKQLEEQLELLGYK